MSRHRKSDPDRPLAARALLWAEKQLQMPLCLANEDGPGVYIVRYHPGPFALLGNARGGGCVMLVRRAQRTSRWAVEAAKESVNE